MIYLVDPQAVVKEKCPDKLTCHPKFYPLYGVPI